MNARTVLIALALIVGVAAAAFAQMARFMWSDEDLSTLQGLSIASLNAPPADPSNRVADDPRAAELGHRLFFDPRLSANGKVACATCHLPAKQFQDGTPLAKGVGTTDRRTMSIIGTRWRARSSTAATARSTRTSRPSTTGPITKQSSDRCRT
jgi:cytochrome c peroxidase